MVFKRTRVQLFLRVSAIFMLCWLINYALTRTDWVVITVVAILTLLYTTYNLYQYINRSRKELASFLLSIRYNDFSATFSTEVAGRSDGELKRAYNSIIKEFQKVKAEREQKDQFLQTLLEHVDLAVVASDEHGHLRWYNSAAKNLLKKPYMRSLVGIKDIDESLYSTILDLKNGERRLIRPVIDGRMVHIAVSATEFVTMGDNYKLITLSDIQNELDQKEIESWQKLIRILTHEIMNSVTPIVSLSGVVEQILEDHRNEESEGLHLPADDADDVNQSIRTIESRGKGLLKFVNTYRSLSKVPDPVLESTDLFALVQRVLNLLRGDLDAQQIRVQVDSNTDDLRENLDPNLMDQVLINLLKNAKEALKDTEEPAISILFQREFGRLCLYIGDNGPGMDAETLERVFIPFYTTKEQGSGIGLSLSRQIMRQHNGSIQVKSAPGEGTTFRLEF
ncbi:GHKL domain-containing protein [Cryomorphaceae bacterium]|nr:GHKL domain-containing protein [Cryomorphaceae bacterium]